MKEDAQKLKRLQCEKHRLAVDISARKHGTRGLRSRLNEVNKQINELTKGEPIISEHAIIRYLQRVLGVDMDVIKNKIIDDDMKNVIVTLGDGRYPIGNGFMVIVKNNVVVSVTGPRACNDEDT